MNKLSLLFILLLIIGLSRSGYCDWKYQFSEDLDSDGKKESILVTFTGQNERDEHGYVIKINNAVYEGRFPYDGVVSAEVVDIDLHDKQKELLLRFDGETDDVIDNFFIYDNGIVKIAEIPGSSVSEVLGDGIVTMNEWMGFWSRDKKYKLEGKYLVPVREEYKINVDSKVSNIMVLYTNPSYRAEVSASLQQDMNIKLKAVKIFSDSCTTSDGYTHECEWYYIEAENGASGWIEYNDLLLSTMDLPWAG